MRLRAAAWGRPYPVIEKSGRAGACPRRKFSQSRRQGQAPALQINKRPDKPQFIGVCVGAGLCAGPLVRHGARRRRAGAEARPYNISTN